MPSNYMSNRKSTVKDEEKSLLNDTTVWIWNPSEILRESL